MDRETYYKAENIRSKIQSLNYGMQILEHGSTVQDLIKFKDATSLIEYMPDLSPVFYSMLCKIQSDINKLQKEFEDL